MKKKWLKLSSVGLVVMSIGRTFEHHPLVGSVGGKEGDWCG
jgi:hypothetical protein